MAPAPARIGEISHWHAALGGPPPRRPALGGETRADVCIIGAGYTGLWAAWYLKDRNPDLDIVICEREFAGFGASGRNGGWLTGGFAWNHERYVANGSADQVRAMVKAMEGTVDAVIAVAEAEGFATGIRRTEEMVVACNAAQLVRLTAEAERRRHWGETRIRMIDGPAALARVNVPGTLGCMVVPNVARIQPAALVRGLAQAVERRGVRIAEGTAVLGIAPGRVETDRGTVSAPVILRATEGFTAGIAGHRRDWLPLNSAQVVTAPLSADIWRQIGWDGYEILEDFANSYAYCQRTDDGRITLGSRGVPYRYGSATDRDGAPDPETVRRLIEQLHRLFPAVAGAGIDHAWCGVLGVPRDWCASVGFDPATGIGWAGGYVGVGVSTSNLAGRTLADLATGADTALVRLPWVNHRVRRWEPEPLRWLGVHGMHALLAAADRAEARGGDPSRLAAIGNWLMGR
ncbi:MAG: NAD(P)/FAD-dependent oxidoreductase [Gemmobacter sp.]